MRSHLTTRRQCKFGGQRQLRTPDNLEVGQTIELISIVPRDSFAHSVLGMVIAFLGFGRQPEEKRRQTALRAWRHFRRVSYTPQWRGMIVTLGDDGLEVLWTHKHRDRADYGPDPDDGSFDHMLEPTEAIHPTYYDNLGLTKIPRRPYSDRPEDVGRWHPHVTLLVATAPA